MKQSRAQKEAKLRKAADEMIKALLDWDEKNEAPSLTQIEEEVLGLRQRIGQEMVEVVMAGQEAQQPAENPKCENCGAEMRYKGQKREDGGESGRRSRGGTRILLLCLLQERVFSPWTGNLS